MLEHLLSLDTEFYKSQLANPRLPADKSALDFNVDMLYQLSPSDVNQGSESPFMGRFIALDESLKIHVLKRFLLLSYLLQSRTLMKSRNG